MEFLKNDNKKYDLIEISDDEDGNHLCCSYSDDDHESSESSKESETTETVYEADSENEYASDGASDNSDQEVVVVKKEKIEAEKPVIEFINYCVDKGLFDDTFYDYTNIFSVMATKLPITFDKMSKNGKTINASEFKKMFKDSGFTGDINYIYNLIDVDKKGVISWDQFIEFFLPFVKYVTM